MALTPPRTLQTLLTGDNATSRVLQNVKTAVDPVLGFVNSTFAVGNDGALSVLRRIKTFAADAIVANSSLTANGAFTANGPAALNAGQAVKGGSTITGNQTVTGNQTTTGNQTVLGTTSSSTGFKADRDLGYAYLTSAVANTRYQTKRFTQSDSNAATFNAIVLMQPGFAGSVIGVQGYSLGTAGGNFTINLFKNATTVPGTGTAPWLQSAAMNANQYFGTPQVFTKGTYAFAASDYFCCAVVWTAGGNQHVQVAVTLEYGA